MHLVSEAMEAKGLDTNLALHEEMGKRFSKSLKQVKGNIIK